MFENIPLLGIVSIILISIISIGLVSVVYKPQVEDPKSELSEIPGRTNFAEDLSEGVEDSKERDYRYQPEDFD